MSPAFQRLLDTSGALSHPATLITLSVAGLGIVGGLVSVPFVSRFMKDKAGAQAQATAAEVRTRTLTWLVIAPLVFAPILAGPLWTMLMACVLSLLCYREFARVTGLFRERLVSALVVVGTLAVTFSTIDHWDGLTAAVQALTLCALCVFSVLPDRPKCYIQRVALGAAAFLLFGVGLLRIGALANDRDYRPLVCSILLCTQMSDVFAFCVGKFARRAHAEPTRLFPSTSPGKTLAGHAGSLLLTLPLAAWMYWLTFKGTPLAHPAHLAALALITALGGQMGDLVMSSVKRDVGVKDMGAMLPGHGGVLDRCNSLLLVVPAVYHYAVFFGGLAKDAPTRVLTGTFFLTH